MLPRRRRVDRAKMRVSETSCSELINVVRTQNKPCKCASCKGDRLGRQSLFRFHTTGGGSTTSAPLGPLSTHEGHRSGGTCHPGYLGINSVYRGGKLGHATTDLAVAMKQIADGLKRLGLSEYRQRFAKNRIGIDVLSDFTDQDLEKLGVLLGHRRRMVKAIHDLGNPSVVATALSAPGASASVGQCRAPAADCDVH